MKKRDAVPHLLPRQQYQNMFLVGRSNAKTIQFKIIGKQDFKVLECQEKSPVELLCHECIELFRQAILDALGAASLGLNETLKFIVFDPFKQIVIDIDRLG